MKMFYNIFDTIELIELNFKNRCTDNPAIQLDLQFKRSKWKVNGTLWNLIRRE